MAITKHLWAVGSGGKVLYSTDGTTWVREILPNDEGRNAVSGVVGGGGTEATVISSGGAGYANSELAVRSPAGVWSWVGTGRGKPIFGLHCWTLDNIDATEMDYPGTGYVRTILQFDGVGWSEVLTLPSYHFYKIHESLSAGAGSTKSVVYFNGVKLGNDKTWCNLRGAYNGGSQIVVGSDWLNGWLIACKYEAPNWVNKLQLSSTYRLEDVHGFGGHVWAVGQHGLIYHSSDGGDNWTLQPSGTTETLNGVFALAVDEVYAVGAGAPNGTILRYDGISWSLCDSSAYPGALNDVWGCFLSEGGGNGDDVPPTISPISPTRNAVDVPIGDPIVAGVTDDVALAEIWWVKIHRGNGWELALTVNAGVPTFESAFEGPRSALIAIAGGFEVRIDPLISLPRRQVVHLRWYVKDVAGNPAVVAS